MQTTRQLTSLILLTVATVMTALGSRGMAQDFSSEDLARRIGVADAIIKAYSGALFFASLLRDPRKRRGQGVAAGGGHAPALAAYQCFCIAYPL